MSSNVILLIEDNPLDAELTRRGLRGLMNPIEWLKSPDEAIAYLKANSTNLPMICLLDLAFPGQTSGMDFLRHIRRVPEWKDLKVIILTQVETEAPRAYAHHVEKYMVKPVNMSKLISLINTMEFVVQITART